jgi:hypothetical protein
LLQYAKITVVFLDRGDAVPDFVGAPYEFWVGGNVGVGTSVGQIRVTDAVNKNHIGYDLLHSYHDGGKHYLVYNCCKTIIKLIARCGKAFNQTRILVVECSSYQV